MCFSLLVTIALEYNITLLLRMIAIGLLIKKLIIIFKAYKAFLCTQHVKIQYHIRV